MSDDPRPLKATLLEDAGTDAQRQFAAMLAGECARVERQAAGHRCLFFVPSAAEMAKIAKYNVPPYDKCPKCNKGRVMIEQHQDNIGYWFEAVCSWGDRGCDFKEDLSGDEHY